MADTTTALAQLRPPSIRKRRTERSNRSETIPGSLFNRALAFKVEGQRIPADSSRGATVARSQSEDAHTGSCEGRAGGAGTVRLRGSHSCWVCKIESVLIAGAPVEAHHGARPCVNERRKQQPAPGAALIVNDRAI